MKKHLIPAILAAALFATLPMEAAFAREGGGGNLGGGGGGGFGGGSHTDGGRGNVSYSRPQNQSGQQLFDQARKDCSGPKYPSGATPRIDYDAGTYSCFEPGSTRR
ncbi:MAG: hypothetical protein IOC82_08770 [Aestuariivirga sp.]|uniref:hypothetical protein n=1 Tax=Aestuariivirga sp. TaxID=2650926 RepID=UPI0025BB691C|nr:hypothetical protein [Aestuariivirga sp.]MCA3561103.1 hypothetical protein [Aestuariivirga sp.]